MHQRPARRFLQLRALIIGTGVVACGAGVKSRQASSNDSVAIESTQAPTPLGLAPAAIPWNGYRFAKLPDSIAYYGGDTAAVNDTLYNFRDVGAGGQRWLWLSTGRGTGPSGAAEWTVVTAMPVTVVDDERIFFADCRLNAKPDHRIIALGLWDDAPLFKRIHRAWRVDPATRTFNEIPVAGVDCVNTDHGE